MLTAFEQQINCSICSASLDFDCKLRYSAEVGIDICDGCAGKIHSAYEAWHGGNGAAEPSRYRKKKISPKLSLAIYRRDGFRCKSCGLTGDLTVDHIVPESAGGGANEDNLQTLCRSCNSKKGVKNAMV